MESEKIGALLIAVSEIKMSRLQPPKLLMFSLKLIPEPEFL